MTSALMPEIADVLKVLFGKRFDGWTISTVGGHYGFQRDRGHLRLKSPTGEVAEVMVDFDALASMSEREIVDYTCAKIIDASQRIETRPDPEAKALWQSRAP